MKAQRTSTPPGGEPAQVRARVHARGEAARLDAVLDFVAFAAKPVPLATLLDAAPRRLAAIVGADVCSIYLLEGDGVTLVMRGNVGFDGGALGQVRLAVGEGITGAVVEILRPISVAAAPVHGAYRAFPELGEERFPVFAAVPILGRRGPLGAVVVQRRGGAPFGDGDVELLTALSATISAAVQAADLVDAARERHAPRRTGGGTRKVTLPGRPLLAGKVVGALAAAKRPPSRPRDERHADDAERLRAAFDEVERALRGLLRRARGALLEHAQFLQAHLDIVGDARLRGEALGLCALGMGVAEALGNVARRVVSSASAGRDAFLSERAGDIEDLCDALVMIAAADPRAELPTRAIVMADRLTVFDVLLATRFRPAGVVLSDRGAGERAQALVALLGVPAITDVGGLFRWASEGDIALLDADHGLLVLNPSKTEIAALREQARAARRGGIGALDGP